jgi:hypothetical protein
MQAHTHTDLFARKFSWEPSRNFEPACGLALPRTELCEGDAGSDFSTTSYAINVLKNSSVSCLPAGAPRKKRKSIRCPWHHLTKVAPFTKLATALPIRSPAGGLARFIKGRDFGLSSDYHLRYSLPAWQGYWDIVE